MWWKSKSSSGSHESVDKALDATVKRVTRTEHNRDSSKVIDKVKKESSVISDLSKWEIWVFLGIFLCVCGSVGVLGALSYMFRSPKVFNETYT